MQQKKKKKSVVSNPSFSRSLQINQIVCLERKITQAAKELFCSNVMKEERQGYVLKKIFDSLDLVPMSALTTFNKKKWKMTHPAQDQAKEKRERSSEVRDWDDA